MPKKETEMDRTGGETKVQANLEGDKLEVEKSEEIKTYETFMAGMFLVRASTDALERAQDMDKKERDKWLKAKMRPIKDKVVTGKDFDKDFTALSSFIFGL